MGYEQKDLLQDKEWKMKNVWCHGDSVTSVTVLKGIQMASARRVVSRHGLLGDHDTVTLAMPRHCIVSR